MLWSTSFLWSIWPCLLLVEVRSSFHFIKFICICSGLSLLSVLCEVLLSSLFQGKMLCISFSRNNIINACSLTCVSTIRQTCSIVSDLRGCTYCWSRIQLPFLLNKVRSMHITSTLCFGAVLPMLLWWVRVDWFVWSAFHSWHLLWNSSWDLISWLWSDILTRLYIPLFSDWILFSIFTFSRISVSIGGTVWGESVVTREVVNCIESVASFEEWRLRRFNPRVIVRIQKNELLIVCNC